MKLFPFSSIHKFSSQIVLLTTFCSSSFFRPFISLLTASLSTSLEVEKFNSQDYTLVTFNCMVSGYPLNGIVWLKDGLPLNIYPSSVSNTNSANGMKNVNIDLRGDNIENMIDNDSSEHDLGVIDSNKMSTKYSLQGELSLSVKILTNQDSGWYQCLVYNDYDSSQSSSYMPTKGNLRINFTLSAIIMKKERDKNISN